MNVQQKLSPFHRLWSLGYRRLIPIIPPDVPVTPTSAIGKKLANGKDGRGKVPGKLLASGFKSRVEALGWEKTFYSPSGPGWKELTQEGQ